MASVLFIVEIFRNGQFGWIIFRAETQDTKGVLQLTILSTLGLVMTGFDYRGFTALEVDNFLNFCPNGAGG